MDNGWIIYLALAIIPAGLAPSRGRRFLVWLFLGLLFPVISLIFVLALPSKKAERTLRKAQLAESADRRPCPRCGESIAGVAQFCRFCGSEVSHEHTIGSAKGWEAPPIDVGKQAEPTLAHWGEKP